MKNKLIKDKKEAVQQISSQMYEMTHIQLTYSALFVVFYFKR